MSLSEIGKVKGYEVKDGYKKQERESKRYLLSHSSPL